MKDNKKIKNAQKVNFGGIKFKSSLEKILYNTLIEQGITPAYESVTYVLSNSIRPTKPFFVRGSSGYHYEMKPLSKITYTPDFTFKLNDVFVIIEAKGYENDVFYLKKNLFRKLIEQWDEQTMFFEVRTKRELLQSLDIIRMETKELSNIRKLIPKLPEKDCSVANKLLAARDFSGLEGLVKVIISRIERDRKKEDSEQRYKEIDLDSLYILLTDISMITIHEDLKRY
jgi:Protein of unknown function (DUF1064).